MARRSILVPHDFTHVADNAVDYAIQLAKMIEGDVAILHIVKEKKDEKKVLHVWLQRVTEETQAFVLRLGGICTVSYGNQNRTFGDKHNLLKITVWSFLHLV